MHPPFNNAAIRRALLGAVNQTDYMTAAGGMDRSLWSDRCGIFTPGRPLANDAGLLVLTGPRDLAKARQDLAAAGYRGERVAFLAIADIPEYWLLGQVAADMFHNVGLNVDLQSVDYATTVQRRTSKEPIDHGGWPDAPRLESLREAWFASPGLAAQQAVCREMQLQAWQDVPFIPLGVLRSPNAYRANLQGMLNGGPLFWNVRRD